MCSAGREQIHIPKGQLVFVLKGGGEVFSIYSRSQFSGAPTGSDPDNPTKRTAYCAVCRATYFDCMIMAEPAPKF
jgi:hypothetical protein